MVENEIFVGKDQGIAKYQI